jgi:hypothetical protein
MLVVDACGMIGFAADLCMRVLVPSLLCGRLVLAIVTVLINNTL